MRFTPTVAQLKEAFRQLPSPYHADGQIDPLRYCAPIYRVAIVEPLGTTLRSMDRMEMSYTVPVVEFRLETLKDQAGNVWRKWIYDGPVAP